MEKYLKWFNHNRWSVLCPLAGLIIWFVAVGCSPVTESPVRPGVQLTAAQLETEFVIWQKQQEIVLQQFEAGRADIERQQQAWSEFQAVLVSLASGNVADLPGLLTLALGSGFVGVIGDNIRKNGVIGGLKKNSVQP